MKDERIMNNSSEPPSRWRHFVVVFALKESIGFVKYQVSLIISLRLDVSGGDQTTYRSSTREWEDGS